jgi:hypothetical protein
MLVTESPRIDDGMLGTLLFDIPVYRTSRHNWQQERDDALRRDGVDPQTHDEKLVRWRHFQHDQYGDYQYNQIMGWVQVRHVGPMGHIKMYLVRVAAKRVVRDFRQGRFAERGKLTEFHAGYGNSSAEIASMIRRELLLLTKARGPLRGRVLDLDTFDALAPAIDFHGLLGVRPRPTLNEAVAELRKIRRSITDG